MATTTTCDHCHRPVARDGVVRINIDHPATFRALTGGRGRSLAERSEAIARETAVLSTVPSHLDLHEHCYDEVIAPAMARVGR